MKKTLVLQQGSEPYLVHSGVRGMKHGVRQYQNRDGTWTELGKARRRKGDDQSRPKKERTAETEKTIAEIQKYDNRQKLMFYKPKNAKTNMRYIKSLMVRSLDYKDKETGLPLKRKTTSPEDDAKVINPTFGNTTAASNNNCCLCTVAFDMRRRGFDVYAKHNAPISLLYDISSEDVKWMYPKSTINNANGIGDIQRQLEKQPEGSRGAFFASWGEGQGGHVVAYQIENNKPVIYDAQDGTKYNNPADLFKDATDFQWMRLDNTKPDINRIKLAIE